MKGREKLIGLVYLLPATGKRHIQRKGKRALCGHTDASAETRLLPYVPVGLCKHCLRAAEAAIS